MDNGTSPRPLLPPPHGSYPIGTLRDLSVGSL
jgi:hypothetical protein